MKTTTQIIAGITVTILSLTALSATAAESPKPFAPRVTGLLKTRFEADTRTGDMRFCVNNARLGIGGAGSAPVGTFRYQFQAELNADGKFHILDTYAAYAVGDFEISAGQQQYRFGTELNRGPRFNYFADASFIALYTGSYFHTSAQDGKVQTGNLGARDIGVVGKYCNTKGIPLNALVGFVNGNGIGASRWRNNLNFVARVWIEPNTALGGMGAAVNLYTGRTPFGDRIDMLGGEIRYINDRWRIEAEYARRDLKQSGNPHHLDLAALHAIYLQPLRRGRLLKFIAPMARWDYGRNITATVSDSDLVHFAANRATAGLTLGFAQSLLKCELRINYEHYFLNTEAVAILENPAFHNKFIVEFFLAF